MPRKKGRRVKKNDEKKKKVENDSVEDPIVKILDSKGPDGVWRLLFSF